MDVKEKRKQYYIDNRDRIIERNKQYYYENREERQKYNYEYWSIMVINILKKERKREKIKKIKLYQIL